ncbi:MAG: MBL fold metallo-hydrolase [bacterium]|nr:MBL fold metallo-hydrolase [bacterium]
MNQVIPISIWSKDMINCFLIKGKNKHILVDTGVPNSQSRIIAQVKAHGIDINDISLIVVTHAHIDHFGSAFRLKQLLDAPILAHELDTDSYLKGMADVSTMKLNKPQWWLFRQMIKNEKAPPFTPDIIMKGDEEYDLKQWGIDGKIIHTPGHTPGSLSIVLENEEVIIMDMMASGIMLGGIMFHNRVKHPPFHDDLSQLKLSFERVLKEKGDRYYLGHGKAVDRSQVMKYYKKYL